ncbi:hypothetical protein [Hymenobacter arizonensis]|uniref:Uncharacterized protein n=1 Tax=Hymenobacter arizonensis TaxID=1227077 RepID=A0A1I5SLP4_HYMAR|nr:hypothetical protein [Hymenobacter arizonensis]SFP71256.1 hypothetical protein SAMN04515668_0094 [Hymenobacter arizonensis]
MTDADFRKAIRRLQWQHWLHYPVQGLLMGCVVLVAGSHTATGQTLEPRLATWPALLVLVALLPVAGLLLYSLYRRMRPNLRRLPEGNLRIYQGRLFLRNSLLALVPLPLLASYVVTHKPFDLLAAGGMLVALCWRLTPTATTYQRWLLS